MRASRVRSVFPAKKFLPNKVWWTTKDKYCSSGWAGLGISGYQTLEAI